MWAQNALCCGTGASRQAPGAGPWYWCGTAGNTPSAMGTTPALPGHLLFLIHTVRGMERGRGGCYTELKSKEHCFLIMTIVLPSWIIIIWHLKSFKSFFFFFLTAPRHWSQRLLGDNPGDVCCSSWLCMLFYGDSRVLLWTRQILKLHYTRVCKTDLSHSPS